jgi:hypothetical protein
MTEIAFVKLVGNKTAMDNVIKIKLKKGQTIECQKLILVLEFSISFI